MCLQTARGFAARTLYTCVFALKGERHPRDSTRPCLPPSREADTQSSTPWVLLCILLCISPPHLPKHPSEHLNSDISACSLPAHLPKHPSEHLNSDISACSL